MTPKAIEFDKVETMRKHMLLTTAQMATLFGVSRVTYHSWVKGSAIRKANEAKVKSTLRHLLHVMTTHNWPSPDVVGMESKQRMEKLRTLLSASTL